MGYAVELFLKEEESQAIRRLFSTTRSVLANIGTTPHVSLAAFEDVDVPMLTGIVRDFAARTPPFSIRMASVGTFPGQETVVFLAPVVTQTLLKAHASLHDQLAAEDLACHPFYLPGAWVPHCTITMETSRGQSLQIIKAVKQAQVFREYTIETVSVVRFRPVVTLSSFRLANGDMEPGVPRQAE